MEERNPTSGKETGGDSLVSQFVNRHFDSIISVCVAVVTIGIVYGKLSTEMRYYEREVERIAQRETQDISNLSSRLTEVERGGTGLSQAHKFLIEQHGKEISEMRADSRKLADDLVEMKTDIRLIVAWVRAQNGGESILKPSASLP